MEQQADLFKDDTINGILLSIQNLQHQTAEEKNSNLGVVHKITKYNPLFRNLINYLDLIFSFGLKDAKRGYWPFVKRTAHSSVIDMVEEHKHATSEIKKGYIWLFLTFVENSLEGYIRMMISDLKLLKLFYKNYALLHDTERCEILLTLLIGLESFTFSIDFDDPYLDFGHDPVLRQEKVIIRVHSPAITRKVLGNIKQPLPQQPDVTIHPPAPKSATYPDLLEAPQNLLTQMPSESSQQQEKSGVCGYQDLDIDLVEHVKRKPQKEASIQKSYEEEQDESEVVSLNDSLELAEDNYIPEIIGSPEYALFVSEDEVDILMADDDGCLQMSDVGAIKILPPDSLSISSGHNVYKSFLKDRKNKDNIVLGETVKDEESSHKEVSTHGQIEEGEDQLTPTSPIIDKIQKLTVREGDGYCLVYVSDLEDTSDMKYVEGTYEDGDIEISPRSDSFDRFCKEDTCESTCSEESSEGQQHQLSTLTEITPEHISTTPRSSISKHNPDRMSESRHSTNIGFLLPTLPRRPDLKEATQRSEEIILDQSEKILLSIEIFSHPTELPVKMFEICIGRLVGLNYIRYLLVSTLSIYLLEKKDAIHTGYVSMISIDTDNIKKVQTGLNFQDVYVVHDNGCFHVSTADEVITRSILLTIKSVIRSSKSISVETEQPMADNTNNELELIIKDWLICHTRVEEPQLIYFGLMQFSVLSPFEQKGRVLKSGYASYRHFLIAGVKTPWDNAFFALRGHILYKYTSRGNEVKNVYDLSKKCGGCIHSGTDGGRFTFKVLGSDGSSPLIELGVDNESEANEWLMTICQVVADAKNGPERLQSATTALVNCGLVMTHEKIYFFNQHPKSGRLTLEDSCSVADISQVCIDNENRTYCTFILDHNVEYECPESSKIRWLLNFRSEYELGKFEQKLYDCWEALYQVPLQFVLLSDITLKRKIDSLMKQEKQVGQIGWDLLMELINN